MNTYIHTYIHTYRQTNTHKRGAYIQAYKADRQRGIHTHTTNIQQANTGRQKIIHTCKHKTCRLTYWEYYSQKHIQINQYKPTHTHSHTHILA